MYKCSGSLVGVTTPFDKNGNIDYGAFKTIVDWHVEKGSNALFVVASTGEPTLITIEERYEITRQLVKMCKGRIPLLMGSSLPTTEETIKFSRFAAAEGVDCLVYSAPYYLLPTQESLLDYWRTAMESVPDTACGVYQNKGRTGVMLDAEHLGRLSDACPNFTMIKESSGVASHIEQTFARVGSKVNLMGVDAPQNGNLLQVMAISGKGFSGPDSNIIPEVMAEIAKPWDTKEQMERCKELYFRYYKLLWTLSKHVGPLSTKAAMNLMGLPGLYHRAPNQSLAGKDLEELRSVMDEYGLLGICK